MRPLKIKDQCWPSGTIPAVSVCCIIYNHEQFVSQCIESVLIQETRFPVEIIIHDDASTDSTPEIIENYSKKYPDLIKVVQQTENQRSKGHKILQLILPQTVGEFIAVCEGDDYWTEPEKLQIQYDLLKENHEISACFHDCVSVEESNGEYTIKNHITWPSDEVETRDLLNGNPAMTCSAYIRRSAFPESPEVFNGLKMGDFPFWILISLKGRISWIHQNMGVYRIHSSGVWSNKPQSEMHLGIMECIVKMGALLPKKLKADHRNSVARHMARFVIHSEKEKRADVGDCSIIYPSMQTEIKNSEFRSSFCDEYIKRAIWLFEGENEKIIERLIIQLEKLGYSKREAKITAEEYYKKYFPEYSAAENGLASLILGFLKKLNIAWK